MQTIKNTKAGVLSWTPAPARISPTSSLMSEDAWEDEDGKDEEQDHDFFSQMDSNGIIRLTLMDEMQKDDGHPATSPGSPSPEEDIGCEVEIPPEELSYILNEHLDDGDLLSSYGDDLCILKEQNDDEDEEDMTNEGHGTEHLSETGSYMDMAQGQINGAGEGEKSFQRLPVDNNKDESERQCFSLPFLFVEANGDCKPPCPTYQAFSCPITSHLCPFTKEEVASGVGIVHGNIPNIGFTDRSPAMSCGSSPRYQQSSEKRDQEDLEEAADSSEALLTNQHSSVSNEDSNEALKEPISPLGQTSPQASLDPSMEGRHYSPKRAHESRKGSQSHWVPDLSKVKPRVSFPKGDDYKPPKSRWSSKNPPKSLTPVVFKSPADIVKEVLLNTTAESQTPSDYNKRTSTGVPSATVPQEFRCQHKAHILAEQLQEDYNRLLTKYAEAANTIDRLRLEARVKLHSEQPRPAHVEPSGLHMEPSKIMKLDFPQAQRAQPSAVSPPPNGAGASCGPPSLSSSISKSSDCQGRPQLANVLYTKADKLLQQLQGFEELLKSTKPLQQMKALSKLYEGLDSLEKGYLLAKKEQEDADNGHFDPNRELEEFIYQCGLHMDELKEKVEQRVRDGNPLSHSTKSSSSLDDSHSEKCHMLDSSEMMDSSGDETKGIDSSLNSARLKRCQEQAENIHPTHAANSRRMKEVRKSCSSSLSSLGDVTEKMISKPQTVIRRALSQDGITSPGTDSGFIGSETSHQNASATPGSLHRRVSKSVSDRQEVRSVKPQRSRMSAPPQGPSHSHSPTPMEPRKYRQPELRRSCKDESKQVQRVSQTDATRADSESTQTLSEDVQRVQYEDSLPCSSPSPSTASLHHYYGDALQTVRASQAVTCNEPSRPRQTISARPKERRESSRRNHKESKADHLAQRNCTYHRTSTPLRSGEPSIDIGGSSRKRWSIFQDETDKVVRRPSRKRPPHKQQPRPDSSTASETEPTACQLLVSRSTQTSIAVPDTQPSHTSAAHVHHIKSGLCAAEQDHAELEKEDSETGGAPPCYQCLSHHSGSTEKSAGGNREAAHFCCCHCHHGPHCRRHDPKTRTDPDCCRDSNPARTSSCKPVSPGRAAAAPVCPTPLLLYLQPQAVHVCGNNPGSPSKISGTKEDRERLRPSQHIIPRRSLDEALLEARRIHDRSNRMVRKLDAGLRTLEQLSKPRSNSN
uniref:microtubule organization protein AKNA isoform X2 n=1 Tax=Doryrhamphus excisus TaxID=161450 RepID=UPI0025AEAA5D|nr:microtubule organization protein AKNA isoform X2 [Doryrhamphus excisus]